MKKLLLTTAIMMLSMTTFAQNNSEGLSKIAPQSEERVKEIYWNIGLNAMNMSGDLEHKKSTIGYPISRSRYKVVPSGGIYWGSEYGLDSRGFGLKGDDFEGEFHADNIYIVPILVGYQIPLKLNHSLFKDAVKVDINLRPYISVDHMGEMTINYEFYGESEEEKIDIYDMEDYSFVDAGFTIGAGLWYKKFNIQLSYKLGSVSLYEGDDDLLTRNFSIRVGYKFKTK